VAGSIRVGLRHMSRVGIRPAVCPTGEQVNNGGFETGDFTGWTAVGATISTAKPHTGTYNAYLDSVDYITQNLLQNVPQQCLTAPTVFGLWRSIRRFPVGGSRIQWRVTLTYTDASTTVVDYDEDSAGCGYGAYAYKDLKGEVASGKTLQNIKIERVSGDGELAIDDVTCAL